MTRAAVVRVLGEKSSAMSGRSASGREFSTEIREFKSGRMIIIDTPGSGPRAF